MKNSSGFLRKNGGLFLPDGRQGLLNVSFLFEIVPRIQPLACQRLCWWSNPPGGVEMLELVEELERQKRNSLDLIVDSRQLRANANGRITVEIPEYGDFELTEWAHSQLAEKLGIPKKYYDRMRNAGKLDLLADNINAWIEERDRRLIRILDGRIRAILSDRYRIMDNYDILFLALDEFKQKETVEIHRTDLTETMMYLKAIDNTLTAEIRDSDSVSGGLIIRNSEVGASSLRVEPFILRQVCSNGLIASQALRKIHLGRQMEGGEIWSDETKELEDKALWAKVRDVIRATFDKQIFESWVEKLRESTEIVIEKPIKAVNNIAKLIGLSEEKKNQLLMHFSEHTKYGLVNAVTTLARESESIDEQIRLEEFGGKLLEEEIEA